MADATPKSLAEAEARLRESLGLAPHRTDAGETDAWSDRVRAGLTDVITDLFSDEGVARPTESHEINQARVPGWDCDRGG